MKIYQGEELPEPKSMLEVSFSFLNNTVLSTINDHCWHLSGLYVSDALIWDFANVPITDYKLANTNSWSDNKFTWNSAKSAHDEFTSSLLLLIISWF